MGKRRKLTSEEKADAARLAEAWRQYKETHAHATQEWMAAQCGWRTQGAFHQYVAGVIPLNVKAAFKISAVLGLSVSELSPRLAALMPNAVAESKAGYGGSSRRIPLFDAKQAAAFASTAARTAAPSVGLDPPLATDCGANTFALVVGDRAMQPDFRQGDVVVVDPEARPQPGEIVAARIEDEEKLVLRKYRVRKAGGGSRKRDAGIELVALNEDFGSIVIDADNRGIVIGPVVEHRRRLKRS